MGRDVVGAWVKGAELLRHGNVDGGVGYEDELFGHGNDNLIVKGDGLGEVNGCGQLASGMFTFNETLCH